MQSSNPSQTAPIDVSKMEMPNPKALLHASKLAVMEDKPIMLDYWVDSTKNDVFIGIKGESGDEKLLVKSAEEYTSPIAKLYRVENNFIICTVNSIYIVKDSIPKKKISN